MAKRKKNREESHVDGAVMDSQEARRVARVLVDEQSSQLSDVAVKAVVVATAVAAAIAADERTTARYRPMFIREQSRGFP